MAGPVGPARVVGQLRVGGFVEPGADAAALILEGGPQFSHHQRVGHEVQGEHEQPAENDLDAVEVDKAVDNVSEAPDRGKSHGRQSIPFYLFCILHELNSSIICSLNRRGLRRRTRIFAPSLPSAPAAAMRDYSTIPKC